MASRQTVRQLIMNSPTRSQESYETPSSQHQHYHKDHDNETKARRNKENDNVGYVM